MFREERRLPDWTIGWVVELILEETEGWSTDSIEPSEGLVRRARRLKVKSLSFYSGEERSFDENFFSNFHQSQSKKFAKALFIKN